jgi:hypothetical protein
VLINCIFNKPQDIEKKNIWLQLIGTYSKAMEILRQKNDYAPQQIEQFQDLIDDFYCQYIDEVGVEGITNYLHLLGSGHIKYYMEIHGNLYKYSQQGWESLNAKYKQIFFNHTQRGGNYGLNTEENERSYIESIMKAFQRELLWTSGVAENYFLSSIS